MRYNSVVIDTSNLFWKSVYNELKKQLSTSQEILFGKIISSSIIRIQDILHNYAYEDSKVFLLFDNPESAYKMRSVISGGKYKHARQNKNIPKEIYPTLDIFHEMCLIYNDTWWVGYAENHEADDLTNMVFKQFPEDKILYVSSDLDWARNINDKCNWFNWKEIYTIDSFMDKFGFSPSGEKIQIYKAIHGDKSDGIDNAVPNLRKEILLDIVNKCDSIKDIFPYIKNKDNLSDKIKNKFIEAYDDIIGNYMLVNFFNSDIDFGSTFTKGKRKIDCLNRWYLYLGLPTIQDDCKELGLFDDKKFI